jgi:hypothetical protein
LSDISQLTKKLARAIQSSKGTRLTPVDLKILAEEGVLEILFQRQADELKCLSANIKSETSGSQETKKVVPIKSIGTTQAEEKTGDRQLARSAFKRQ